MNNPTKEHLREMYRILHYLKENPGNGLYFKKTSNRDIEIFFYANWAGSIMDQRSTIIVLIWGEFGLLAK